MKKLENNFAYIDGNNLYKGINELGWRLDYVRFRTWLTEKYNVSRAYLFIGLIPSNKALYRYLQEAGFILIFKETIRDIIGKHKGNCDADLVLQVTRDVYENKFNKAIIVTNDGDFACLILFLIEKAKLRVVLSPSNPKSKKCSYLIRRIQTPIVFLDQIKSKLAQKEKAPNADGTALGSFS